MGNKVKTVIVGYLEVNCYLVRIGAATYVIDPGAEPDLIIPAAREIGGDVKAVLLTHGHVDHIGAAKAVSVEFGNIPVYLHKEDHPLYFSPNNAVPPFIPPIKELARPVDAFDSEDVRIIHTPGHSRGCVCFHFPALPALFCGDTLFRESVGRTDLPGGDFETLLESIHQKLFILPGDTPAYPGHGPATTLAHEKSNNVFLR